MNATNNLATGAVLRVRPSVRPEGFLASYRTAVVVQGDGPSPVLWFFREGAPRTEPTAPGRKHQTVRRLDRDADAWLYEERGLSALTEAQLELIGREVGDLGEQGLELGTLVMEEMLAR